MRTTNIRKLMYQTLCKTLLSHISEHQVAVNGYNCTIVSSIAPKEAKIDLTTVFPFTICL
jgi:hypothetical protein